MKDRTRQIRSLVVAALLGAGTLSATGCHGGYTFIGLGTAVDVLPHGFVSVTVGTVPYYFHRGVFYRPYRRGFVAVAAPIGAFIMAPPPGHVMIMMENDPYYYYHGVFYAPVSGRYRVVRAPIGAFVRRVPESAESRRVDGVEYKEYAGTYYRPAIRDGRRGYQVSEPPGSRRER